MCGSITIKKLFNFAVKVDEFDVPRFNALCRGEELRVSHKREINPEKNAEFITFFPGPQICRKTQVLS